MNKLVVGFLLFLFCVTGVVAQAVLTLDDAIGLTLKNNYAITIVKNNQAVAASNASIGNAGFLPQVALNASNTLSSNDIKQSFSSGLDLERAGVQSKNLNASVGLNWTLFDGLKMFATYDKLKELKAMGELNTRIQIENTLSQLMRAYYEVVRQKQLIKATQSLIAISEERLKIIELRSELGSAARPDVLQAKIDINTLRSNLIKQNTALTDAKTILNQLMIRKADTQLDVVDSIAIVANPVFDELYASTLKLNNSLLFAQRNMQVANYLFKEIRSQELPQLYLNLNYNFARSENQAGFALLNQSLGFNGGFGASWIIFNGFKTHIQKRNAQLLIANSGFEYDQAKLAAETNLIKAYNQFKNALEALKLESESVGYAKENVSILFERFRLGRATTLEIKEAQRSLEDATTRLVNARYDAKIAETELLRISGLLIK